MGRWGMRPIQRALGHTTCCSAPKICWKSTDYRSALLVNFAIILVDPKRDDNVFYTHIFMLLVHWLFFVIPGMQHLSVAIRAKLFSARRRAVRHSKLVNRTPWAWWSRIVANCCWRNHCGNVSWANRRLLHRTEVPIITIEPSTISEIGKNSEI